MPFSTVLASDILPRLPGMVTGVDSTKSADFGEVSLLDIHARHPQGVGVAQTTGDDWAALAYAVPNPDGAAWTMEISLDRKHVDVETFATGAAAHLSEKGIDQIVLWIHDQRLNLDHQEFALDRTLHRLTLVLPIDQMALWPDGVRIAGFGVEDAAEWLRVNNRAFEGHPEQGEWTAEDLARRLDLDWFDPAGFRMIWLNERLAAFNWTKIHRGEAEIVGEIHVIAVDPEFRGRGLGKSATLEGLRYLHESRGATRAILYVDGANSAGMRLYEGLGFLPDEIHRAYRWRPPKS